MLISASARSLMSSLSIRDAVCKVWQITPLTLFQPQQSIVGVAPVAIILFPL
jgi:hypothetical protein